MRKPVLFIAIIFLANNFIFAQSVYFGLGGGYTSISGQSYNNAIVYQGFIAPWSINEINNSKAESGFNISGCFKFLVKDLPISLISGISYTKLSGSTDNVKYPSPPWYSSIYSEGNLESESNLITVSTGVQWEILRYNLLSPFISFNLLYNFFDKTKLQIADKNSVTNAILIGKNRFGISFGGGVNVKLISFVDMNLSGSYSLNNLVGKETDEKAINSFNVSMILFFKML